MKIYVASSWRNSFQPGVVLHLRQIGFDVYDFKNPEANDHGFHWSEIDTDWKNWSNQRFINALEHPIAERGYKHDMDALIACDVCVLVLPCGKSAHLELGYAVGMHKNTAIFAAMRSEPELMYKMVDIVTDDLFEIEQWLKALKDRMIQKTIREQIARR